MCASYHYAASLLIVISTSAGHPQDHWQPNTYHIRLSYDLNEGGQWLLGECMINSSTHWHSMPTAYRRHPRRTMSTRFSRDADPPITAHMYGNALRETNWKPIGLQSSNSRYVNWALWEGFLYLFIHILMVIIIIDKPPWSYQCDDYQWRTRFHTGVNTICRHFRHIIQPRLALKRLESIYKNGWDPWTHINLWSTTGRLPKTSPIAATVHLETTTNGSFNFQLAGKNGAGVYNRVTVHQPIQRRHNTLERLL